MAKQTAFRFPDDLKARLDAECARRKITISAGVFEAVTAWLEPSVPTRVSITLPPSSPCAPPQRGVFVEHVAGKFSERPEERPGTRLDKTFTRRPK